MNHSPEQKQQEIFQRRLLESIDRIEKSLHGPTPEIAIEALEQPGLEWIRRSLERIEAVLGGLVRSDRPKLSQKAKGSDELPAERSDLTDAGLECPCGEEKVEFLFHRWSQDRGDSRIDLYICPACDRVFHVSNWANNRGITIITPEGRLETRIIDDPLGGEDMTHEERQKLHDEYNRKNRHRLENGEISIEHHAGDVLQFGKED